MGQMTWVRMYLIPAVHSPATVLVPPAPYHTTGPVVGGWRGKNKPYFDNVSLIDSDSFQVSFSFPNLPKAVIIVQHKAKTKK